jgi:hypothetical protein
MNKNEQNHHRQEGQEHNNSHHNHSPYWRRAHRDWRIWVGMFLMLAAIIYYIMSEDFAFAPHRQPKQQSENNRTP